MSSTLTTTNSFLPYLRPTAITANGIFAGLGLTITFAGVPMLRAAKYPVEAWAVLYDRGHKIAIPAIFLSSAAYFSLYYNTKITRYLWCGAIAFTSFPWTLMFMKKTNDRLHTINRTKITNNTGEVASLVEKWDKLQLMRTAAGTLAFLLAVW
ncbi:hypothetical protein BX666DRAFT_1941231 [Dichotomocladium elegans]|nr:hypothetical protein BX666DRAFT_1941231 [Dichotomocladium elegans]